MHRPQLVRTVTWRIVTDILRRHHERYNLRLLELRPGSGQNECVSILQEHGNFPGTPLCHFNPKGDLHIADPESKVVSLKEDFVEACLAADDPQVLVNHIELLLGLPEYKYGTLPGTTRPLLIFRLIAGIMERFAFSRAALSVQCGWSENPGHGTPHIRDDLMLFPPVAQAVRERISRGQSKAEASAKYWILWRQTSPSKDPKLFAVLDLAGRIYYAHDPDTPWDAYGAFKQAHRRLRPVLNEFESEVRQGETRDTRKHSEDKPHSAEVGDDEEVFVVPE